VCVILVLLFFFCNDHHYLLRADDDLGVGSPGDGDNSATVKFFIFTFIAKFHLLKNSCKVYLLPFFWLEF